jgi:hypothetical protein
VNEVLIINSEFGRVVWEFAKRSAHGGNKAAPQIQPSPVEVHTKCITH